MESKENNINMPINRKNKVAAVMYGVKQFPQSGENVDNGGAAVSDLNGVASHVSPPQDSSDVQKMSNNNKAVDMNSPHLSGPGVDSGRKNENSTGNTRFIESFKSFMLPKDTPERRRRIYARSKEALNDIVGEYYEKELKQLFDANKKDAAAKARKEMQSDVYNLMNNPMHVYARVASIDDPVSVMDRTMKSMDEKKLKELVSPYALCGGFDEDYYIENFVKPSLRDRMLNEYVKESMPKSRGEYVVRSAMDNSLMGKLVSLPVSGEKSVADRRAIDNEAMAKYNSGRMDDFVAGLGSLVIDLPLFNGIGKISSAVVSTLGRKITPFVAKRIAGKVMANSMNPRMDMELATKVAERAIKQNLKYRLTGGALSQGLTLGNYDASNSVVSDLLSGNSVGLGSAAKSFGRGLLLGGASAAAAAPLRIISKGTAGAKKFFYSTGVLCSESAVFTAGGEIEKIANGVEVEPVDLIYDFAGNTATILTLRLANWRPKGKEYKLDYKGRIKKEFKLSSPEMKEIESVGFNPKEFVAAIENELRIPSYGGSENANNIKEIYSRLMADKNLSAATKSKLMFLVENKVTSTPPVPFDYDVERNSDGKYEVKLFDFEGNLIEQHGFESMESVRSYMFIQQGKLRKNRIELLDKELTAGLQSQNFYRHAGLYLRASGADVNGFVDALYEKSQGKEITPEQQRMLDEVLRRSSFDNENVVRHLYDSRRNIEQKFGLEDNTLIYKAAEPYYMLRENEIAAIREYEELLHKEVEQLKEGTGRSAVMSSMSSEGGGDKNPRVTTAESEFREHNEKVNRESILGTLDANAMKEKPIDVFKEPTRGVVWNVYGNHITKEQLDANKSLVKKMSKRLGVDINIIVDEREIKRPDPDNKSEVCEYNSQVRAYGWINDGKVYVNLPNCPTAEIVEKVIVHEVVGHQGLEKVFGYHLYDFLEDIYKSADDKLRYEIESMGKSQYRGTDNFTIVEEYLTHLTEKAWLNEKERTIMQRFKDFIKDMFRRMGIYKESTGELTTGEIERLIALHCRYVRNRVNPERHRKEVFGRFESSHHPKSEYYNYGTYIDNVRSRIEEGTFFRSTPDYLRGYKALLNYDRLPVEYKEKFLKDNNWKSEEEVYEILKNRKFRLPENWDKKTSPGERGGVIPGYPSSKGLVQSGNGHLSTKSLTSQEDDAKLMRNTIKAEESPLNNINNGEFGNSADERAAVDMLDASDYRNRENYNSVDFTSFMEKIKKEYKAIKQDIEFVEAMRESMRVWGGDSVSDKAFKDKYGISVDDFKDKFPTDDEYIYYRLIEKGHNLNNGVEEMPENDSTSGSATTADGIRRTSLDEIERRVNGPLDILHRSICSTGTMLNGVGHRLLNAGLSLQERADIEDEIEAYAMHLLKKRKAGNISQSPRA